MSKSYTRQALESMTLRELAAAANIPSLTKMSKTKALERALKVVKLVEDTPAPKAPSKYSRLLLALTSTSTRETLMEASGFDNKNLSVALSILKRGGHVIRCDIKDSVRLYSLV
jgi:hypothetical protein